MTALELVALASIQNAYSIVGRSAQLPQSEARSLSGGRVTSDGSEIISSMRTTSVRVGDIVYANKRGRHFHAKVLELAAGGTLLVEPIERNISYRHLEASEITEHWARNTPTRRAAGASKPQPTQLPLAL